MTTELPMEGKQGQPTTGSSAPGANQTSSNTGRAPVAGSSVHQGKDPEVAQETRPVATSGPTPMHVTTDEDQVLIRVDAATARTLASAWSQYHATRPEVGDARWYDDVVRLLTAAVKADSNKPTPALARKLSLPELLEQQELMEYFVLDGPGPTRPHREDACTVCGRGERECQAAQAKLIEADRHQFEEPAAERCGS